MDKGTKLRTSGKTRGAETGRDALNASGAKQAVQAFDWRPDGPRPHSKPKSLQDSSLEGVVPLHEELRLCVREAGVRLF